MKRLKQELLDSINLAVSCLKDVDGDVEMINTSTSTLNSTLNLNLSMALGSTQTTDDCVGNSDYKSITFVDLLGKRQVV